MNGLMADWGTFRTRATRYPDLFRVGRAWPEHDRKTPEEPVFWTSKPLPPVAAAADECLSQVRMNTNFDVGTRCW